MDILEVVNGYPDMVAELSVYKYQVERLTGMKIESLSSEQEFIKAHNEAVSKAADLSPRNVVVFQEVMREQNFNADEFSHYYRKYNHCKKDIDFFKLAIKQLSGKLPDIMQDMWINKIGWGALLDKYYVSDTMMRKYRKKALAELEEYYHKKEQEEIEYMLS